MSLILIVEDERDIADLVAHTLQKDGYSTEVVGSGTDALTRARARRPDWSGWSRTCSASRASTPGRKPPNRLTVRSKLSSAAS